MEGMSGMVGDCRAAQIDDGSAVSDSSSRAIVLASDGLGSGKSGMLNLMADSGDLGWSAAVDVSDSETSKRTFKKLLLLPIVPNCDSSAPPCEGS